MLPELHIRAATLGDAPGLAVLAAQVWLHTYATDGVSPEIAAYVLAELIPAKFAESIEKPSTQVLLAEQAGNLVGLAVVERDIPCPAEAGDSMVELKTLYVQAHFLGQGVGAALLRTAEAWGREQGQQRLWLTVNAQNRRAIGFYQHQGYTQVGTTYFELGTARHENHVLVGGG